MDLQSLGKLVIGAGLVIAVVGVVLYLAGHWSLPLGRLPGDIRVERPGFRFYFPITTSILISVILSLILYLVSRLR